MAKILIVGCGDIGCRLAKLLYGEGHQVFGLKRNPPTAPNKIINYLRADINHIQDLAQLDDDYDSIFYMPTPNHRDPKSYKDIYITGLKKLLNVFSSVKNKPHFFFISSTSVYGQNNGEWVNEHSPTEPTRATARCIVEGEQILWQDNPGHTVIRFSGIYGSGRGQLLTKLINCDPIQHTPPYFTNRIHQDDCAAILAFLFNKKLSGYPLEPCYLASDDDPAPRWEVMTWLAEHTGNSQPNQLLQPPIANQNKRCQNNKLKQLGYRFIYPSYRDGYMQIDA